MATQPRDIDSPIGSAVNSTRWTLPKYGPSQPNSRSQLFRFCTSHVAVKSDRVGAWQARSLQHKTTGRAGDQQPASQPARLRRDGRTSSLAGPHSPCPLYPSPIYIQVVYMASSLSHTRTTPTSHLFKSHVTCTGSYHSTKLVAAGAVVPLQFSHRPQIRFFQCLTCPKLLRFVRPPAQQTDDETSPHWHRTVGCSGAPSEASEAAE